MGLERVDPVGDIGPVSHRRSVQEILFTLSLTEFRDIWCVNSFPLRLQLVLVDHRTGDSTRKYGAHLGSEVFNQIDRLIDSSPNLGVLRRAEPV